MTDLDKINWFKVINFFGTPQDLGHLDKIEHGLSLVETESSNDEVDHGEFIKWVGQTEVVYASDEKKKKVLKATLYGSYIVTVDGKTIHHGMQTYPATEAYNAI